MNDQITIYGPQGSRSFANSPITIGRSPQNTIVIESPVVSRSHAILSLEVDGWHYRDNGSSLGTTVRGERISEVLLSGAVELVLGTGERAIALQIIAPTAGTAPPAAVRQPDRAAPAQAFAATQTVSRHAAPAAQPARSPNPPRPASAEPGTAEPTASPSPGKPKRHVAKVKALAAATSVAAAIAIASAFAIPAVNAETTSADLASTPAALAAAPTGGHDGASTADLDAMVRATVRLGVEYDVVSGGGSGVVINAQKGLILTNAHVVSPSAPGIAVQYGDSPASDPLTPERIVVSVADGLDRSAEEQFLGEVVAVDGYLDLAIVKVTRLLSGTPVSDADLTDLEALPLGDSDAVSTGDPLTIVGFPSQAESAFATVTTGIVSGSQADDRLATARGWFTSDALSARGNSGGLVANDRGEIIGVSSKTLRGPQEADALSGARPINFVLPLLKAVDSGAGYQSPYASALAAEAQITDVTFGAPASSGRGIESGCTPGDGEQGAVVAFAVEYQGFGAADHTDVIATVRKADQDGSATNQEFAVDRSAAYPSALPTNGCMTITVGRLEPGDYFLSIGAGGSYTELASIAFTI